MEKSFNKNILSIVKNFSFFKSNSFFKNFVNGLKHSTLYDHKDFIYLLDNDTKERFEKQINKF